MLSNRRKFAPFNCPVIRNRAKVYQPILNPVDDSISPAPFNTLALITSWFEGGVNLAVLSATPCYSDGFPLSMMLSIAIQLCSVVGAVHRESSFQRRGLTCSNILYNCSTGQVALIDYGLPPIQALDARVLYSAATDSDSDSDDESNHSSDMDDCNQPVKSSASSTFSSSTVPSPLLPQSSITQQSIHGRANFLWRCFLSPSLQKLIDELTCEVIFILWE